MRREPTWFVHVYTKRSDRHIHTEEFFCKWYAARYARCMKRTRWCEIEWTERDK